MRILYRVILFSLFFAVLLISMRLDTRKRLWLITGTALILYALSEVSSFLNQKWFPSRASVVVSDSGTRGLRISDGGKIQTAILKPIVEIKSAELKDARNHPELRSRNYHYAYEVTFRFVVVNGIEHSQSLRLKGVVATFDINDGESEIESNLKYKKEIPPKRSISISTNEDHPIFLLGSAGKMSSCGLTILCKFEKYKNLVSQKIKVSLN